jgi:hypothetical protein
MIDFRTVSVAILSGILVYGCGSSDDSSFGGGGTAGSATGGSAGGGATSGGAAGNGATSGGAAGNGAAGGGGAGTDAGSGGAAGSAGACSGTHPLLDAGTRFCAAGECRCVDTDTCYSQSTASGCCKGKLECFTADGGVSCEGTHPLLDGGLRFCAAASCYCSANDTCFPAKVAKTCCGVKLECY